MVKTLTLLQTSFLIKFYLKIGSEPKYHYRGKQQQYKQTKTNEEY
ncbi:hypothetical protein BH18THE2_BH18THE2_11500 [soil metagenome]